MNADQIADIKDQLADIADQLADIADLIADIVARLLREAMIKTDTWDIIQSPGYLSAYEGHMDRVWIFIRQLRAPPPPTF